MLCDVKPALAGVIAKEFDLEDLARDVSYARQKDFVRIDLEDFPGEKLQQLKALLQKDEKTNRGTLNSIKIYERVMADPEGTPTRLSAFPSAFRKWMQQDRIKGWMFLVNEDQTVEPVLMTSVSYTEADAEHERPAYCTIRYSYIERGVVQDDTEVLHAADISGKKMAEILLTKKLHKETAEFHAQYKADIELYLKFRDQFGEQFLVEGWGYQLDQHNSNRYWGSRTQIAGSTGPAKMVNDEETLQNRVSPSTRREVAMKGRTRRSRYENEGLESLEIGEVESAEIPVNPYVLLFHLEKHDQMWVHARYMKEYVYKPELRDMLVLPESQKELIDILTADIGVLMDDVVEGKSGGSTILCHGGPGLGKTLTAEVYSEYVKRPLYRVDSSQLGSTIEAVEENLKDCLQRATRWKAVMLIDEGDVYMQHRGTDLELNAITAVFLRTLEYYNGLLFITSNRADDLDDAIISRCVALVHYHTPNAGERNRLWTVLAKQFQVELDEELRTQLVSHFPTTTGRDIKNLLKLSARYTKKKGVKLDLDVFRLCSTFRNTDFLAAKERTKLN
jgi:hypothetical protein